MTNYGQLAVIYLKHNKKRSLVTIIGVAFCVVILFNIMNLAVSYIITAREAQREKTDYEAVFLCEDENVAQKLAGEDCFRNARVEDRYGKTAEEEEASFSYGVLVNFKNPYRMVHYADGMAERYHVDYELSQLAEYYLQDRENDMILTLILSVLLVSFIFAVMGVGIIRNSIHLILLERIKDYGILRCMGSTRGQLKKIIYSMGMILEMGGMALGILAGYPVYLALAERFRLQTGFHIIVLPFILIAFLGDLYFVMLESVRFVNNLTPVAAIAGKIKIRKEKIKARHSGLLRKIFGLEGDYAFKNLMRNPSGFWKTLGSVSFGIAMIIVVFSIDQCINTFISATATNYGKYQIYSYLPIGSVTNQVTQNQGNGEPAFPDLEMKKRMEGSQYITEAKPVYAAVLYLADIIGMTEHYTEEYISDSQRGNNWKRIIERVKEGETKESAMLYNSGISLFGYDEADYRHLGKELIEGTLDVSPEGIVLVNHCYTSSVRSDLRGNIMMNYMATDYRVGDKITVVDFRKLSERAAECLEEADAYGPDVEFAFKYEIFYDCYRELVEQGETRTYTIEGIVKKDSVLTEMYGKEHFVLPLERYFEDTGITEDIKSGMMYHLKGKRADDALKKLSEEQDDIFSSFPAYRDFDYISILQNIGKFQNVIMAVAFFGLFVVLLNIMNILNTTASSLHLRRKEFAQLRVLGMSKKQLGKTIMLEGILMTTAANMAGLVLGVGISLLAIYMINLIFYVEFNFPWGAYGVVALVSFLLLCGSIYINLKGMKMSMAEELSGSGE